MPALSGEADQQPVDPNLLRPIRAVEELLRLRGPPGALVGVVSLSRGAEPACFNRASRNLLETEVGYRMSLTEARLISSSLPAAAADATYLRFGAELAPCTSARVPVRCSVARTTPPGLYEALFDVGGAPLRAEIEILPDERLAIGGGGLTLSGAPGEIVRGELLFSNRGNVKLKLEVLGGLILEDLEPLCLSLQKALSQVRDKKDQQDAHRLFLDAFVKNVADQRADLGRVRLAAGPFVLEAGDSAMLEVEFHLPANMTPGRHYRATLEYGEAQVSVRIDAVAPARRRAGAPPPPKKEAM